MPLSSTYCPSLNICTYEGKEADESKTVCAYRSAPVAAKGKKCYVEDTTAFIVDEEGKIFHVAEGWSRQAVQDGVSEGGCWTPNWFAFRISSHGFLLRESDTRYPDYVSARLINRVSKFEMWHLDVPFVVNRTQARLSKREIAERIRGGGGGVPSQDSNEKTSSRKFHMKKNHARCDVS